MDLPINIKIFISQFPALNSISKKVLYSLQRDNRFALLYVCFIISLFSVTVISCSRTNPKLSENIEDTKPEPYFSVKTRNGYRTITDRNGNIKDTAYVQRICMKTEGGKGSCKETITYHSGKQEERNFNWNIHYEDTRKILLTIDSGDLHMEGYHNSRMILLKGKWSIPQSDVALSSEWKIFRWSGTRRISEEIQDYYWMGFYSGTARTLWTETDDHQ